MNSPSTNHRSQLPRRQFTKEFKGEAVALARRPDIGFAKAAKDLGINESLLRTWAKKLAREGSDAFRGHGIRTTAEGELERLRRENAILRMERDILDAAWQGPCHQGGANPLQVTARHGPGIQPWRYIGNDVLYA